MEKNGTIYDFEVNTLNGDPVKLSEYKGKTMLIVNTASQCGFTPQYKGLQQLYDQFRDSGLVILGFPCNQFGHQEPGTENDIKTFCDTQYKITFPMFEKINVNGPEAAPLYKFLKNKARGLFGVQRIHWNFTKFLISPDGRVIRRFASPIKPESMRNYILRYLPQ